jgi:hypothetical protein
MARPSAELVERADRFERLRGDTLTVQTSSLTRRQWALLHELQRRGWAVNSDGSLTQVMRIDKGRR